MHSGTLQEGMRGKVPPPPASIGSPVHPGSRLGAGEGLMPNPLSARSARVKTTARSADRRPSVEAGFRVSVAPVADMCRTAPTAIRLESNPPKSLGEQML